MPGIVFALICWGVWFIPAPYVDLLIFERNSLITGEWWRLWTGHLTHFTLSQLIADSGVVAILGYLVQRYLKDAFLLVSFLLAMPIISGLIFWLVPEMSSYRGASAIGALMWTLAGCLFLSEYRRNSLHFWMGCLFLVLLIVKISGEALLLFPTISQLGQGVQVAWQAHLFGATGGFIIFAVHRQLVRNTDRKPSTEK